jgi:signal transduction histidine kinase/ligand-binding sensor domain-containing protein
VCDAELLHADPVQRARPRSGLNRLPARIGNRFAVLLALLFSCGVLLAAAPNYFTRMWQTDDGLPQNGVSAILQTRDGYLWIGTYGGLARFDGVRFVVFNNSNTPQMYSRRVTSLFEDGAGTLWIGFETGGMTRYRDGTFQMVQISPAWSGRKIVAIGADTAGDIWALGLDGSLLRLRDQLILSSEFGGTSELGSLVKDQSGHTWVLWNNHVNLLEDNHLSPAPFTAGLTQGYVQGLCASRDGGLWVASEGRLRKWREDQWTNDSIRSPWGADAGTSTLLEMRNGRLAGGVVDYGLYLIESDGATMFFNRTNGLPSDWIRALCEDREGNLWVGTGNGLAVLREGKVATVRPPDQWQGRGLLSVTAARNGALWIGTEGAGLYCLNQGAWKQYGQAEGVSNLFVWAVSEDSQNRLWAGTWGAGLLVQRGDLFERPPGLENDLVPMLALLHVAPGDTWIGTETELIHYQEGNVERYGRNKGLIYPDVRAVVQDAEGNVWFGMLGGGLGLLKSGAVRQFRKANGLSSNFIQCLRLDQDGALWIGTFGGGLNRLKQGRFAAIGTGQGLPNDVICDIEDDGRGNFWFSSHGGIFRVSKELLNLCADGLTNSVYCLAYDKGDGLPTLECSGGFQPAGAVTPDGRLWFPTSKGLVVVDPNERNINHLPPPVVIEDLLADGQSVMDAAGDEGPLRISPGHNRFEFRYTGLSLAAPQKVKFKYRLEGLESEWVDAGSKRVAEYSFIPPGDYAFRVIACNNDGIWNETGASLSIAVLPHFWQTWWFRAFSGLLLAAALGGGVWFDTRRRMHRKLERLEREQAIERERARIAKDIHDDLGASLTRITLLSQSARSELDDRAPAATNLDHIYRTARELTRAMDEIVWAVNPQHDTLDSLASYLSRFAQDFLGAAGVSCRLDVAAQLPAWPLTAEVRHNVFLAFKEALHNAIKHAAATEVRVSLILQEPAFLLTLEDNGRGFALEPPKTGARPGPDRLDRGHGLANIRRRLAEIGGECEVQSTPGQGTRIRFRVPVNTRQPEKD